jgi:Transposase DDE domain
MLNEVMAIVAGFDCIPKRLVDVVSGYVGFLSLAMKRHSFQAAAGVVGLHESRFSVLMNDPATEPLSRDVLSRAVRRRLARLKRVDGRLVVIIDATIKKRRGKNVENTGLYHSGAGLVNGHKFVNFVVLDGRGNIIPLESVPVLNKAYCRENGLKYRTEIDIVKSWIENLRQTALFGQSDLESALFLLDSGYDAKVIQRAIKQLGADFVMALKSSRTINGRRVSELFRASRRWLAWETIRLKTGSGGKGSRRIYSIRTQRDAYMKGFGLVHVVCSKADHNRKKPRKFLVTSCLEMGGRDIVRWYSMRWRIETWHRDMKQNYGFIDCHSARFTAQAAHINLSLTAYLLQKGTGREQMRIEEHVRITELRGIRVALTKFGATTRLKTLVDTALEVYAA